MVFSLLNTVLCLNFSWLSETLALLSSWGSFSGYVCCFRPATAQLIIRQRGVATELTKAIPAVILDSLESFESAVMNMHLPPGDNLSTTLWSPQFSQALSMFWSALQSGQASPVIHQFGLGPDAVNAAATGNIEEFVSALESEAKSGQGQQAQQGQDDKKQSSSTTSPDKKDDDDEGMALDWRWNFYDFLISNIYIFFLPISNHAMHLML